MLTKKAKVIEATKTALENDLNIPLVISVLQEIAT
jgi:hypothetical protein